LILLTSPTFHAAYQIMPWIIAGLLLNGLYFFPVNFLFLKSKTGWVPTVTVMSGLVNVGLNLWLTPSYGIIAAAWATLLAYTLMLLLVWFISQRIYPFPYEYRRLGMIALVTICLFALGTMLQSDSMVIDLGIKATLLLAYPLVLMALSFYTSAEKVMMLNFVQQILRGKQRTVFEK
ncbi:MAG: polysaccharide biosynthesis C-terminal domain-containing protein, partial [Ignavibacteriaceae bacterium]|nr:polysaccharide biosynthesis C-terminal domain-containing protein [Ignavibacteriaceae bacterium]